jgi:hypothetical protein
MSDNTKIEVTDNSNELTGWIEEAIAKDYIKQYDYKNFSNIEEIGSGKFGKVYRANLKNLGQYVALKYFFKINSTAIKEIIREVIIKYNRTVYF